MSIRVLLIDDDYGRPDWSERVLRMFRAARVVSAETAEVLASAAEPTFDDEAPARREVMGNTPIELWVSTGQQSDGVDTNSIETVRRAIERGWPFPDGSRWSLVLIDLVFADNNKSGPFFGEEIFGVLEERCPGLRGIAFSDVPQESAEASLGWGARRSFVEHLSKRDVGALATRLREALRFFGLLPDIGGALKGTSLSWLRVLREARVKAHERTILISGPVGSGKEGLARYIYEWSDRPGKYVVVDLGEGVADPQLTALFGIEKKSATGVEERPGAFERAMKGSVVLNEIHNADMSAQGRLLSVLEVREDGKYHVVRVGTTTRRAIDVQTIAVTNLSVEVLQQRAAVGTFRGDLLDRLAGDHPIVVPPLSARRDDLGLLVEHFVRQAEGPGGNRARRVVPPESVAAVATYLGRNPQLSLRWLRDCIARAVAEYPKMGTLFPAHLEMGARDQAASGGEGHRTVASSEHASSPIPGTCDIDEVRPEDLGRAVRSFEHAAAAARLRAYIRLLAIYGERSAAVRALAENPALRGTAVSDQLLKWGETWRNNGINIPATVRADLDAIATSRRRRGGRAT